MSFSLLMIGAGMSCATNGFDMKLNRRGRFILRGLPVFAVLAWLLWQISTKLWWVEGGGYCWGTMAECF
jgi:hypothetical protein